jgi:glucan phosphoethanolaminetransferase (alkaline phosphatase superfamily)
MYPVWIYLMIIVIDGALTFLSLVKVGAGSYRDMLGFSNITSIVVLGLATFLSVYLALASVSGTTYAYASSNNFTYAINTTGNTTNVTMVGNPGVATSPIMDDGLMWIWYLIAVIQAIFVLLEILEAYAEHLAGKEERGNLIS